jgi:hypothetical protein
MRPLPRKGMRKVTIILVRRDNEGTKAGAFKTDLAGLLNNHHPGTPGQRRNESRCLQDGHDRAFIKKKEEKGEENHGK